jgi:hypothetical protein
MALDFLTLYKHLLPKARAWNITLSKPLRWFFEGLSVLPGQVRDAIELGWADLFADTTRDLDKAEKMWNLPYNSALTTAQRRARLLARKREQGGQSPRYIEDTLQAAGFDVYVHEWFDVPATVPPVPALVRNPNNYLVGSSYLMRYFLSCDEPLAQCDELSAMCNASSTPLGYLLVNKLTHAMRDVFVQCDEPLAMCDEHTALCDNFDKYAWLRKIYNVPTDPAQWPYVLYIGGAVFGEQATVANARRDEFEDLVLRLCPAQQWLGILVSYN